MMGWKQALFYEKLGDGQAKCTLCYRYCIIPEGQTGFCNAYINVEGDLYSITYGRPVIVEAFGYGVLPFDRGDLLLAPIEKRLIVSTAFCNFRCRMCSNSKVAFREQPPPVHPYLKGFCCFNGADNDLLWAVEMSPEDIVSGALSLDCGAIRFAYNEPTVFFEYLLDIARLAKKAGLKVYIETNGYITEKPIETVAPYVDCVVVSFKASGSNAFFDGIDVPHVLPRFETVRRFKQLGVWTVVYDLLVEGLDFPETVSSFCQELVRRFGEDQRLLFGVAHAPGLKLVPPIEERQKKFMWAYECALQQGLHDVMFAETVPAGRLKKQNDEASIMEG